MGIFLHKSLPFFLLYKAVLSFWEDKVCAPRIDNMQLLANFSSTSNRNVVSQMEFVTQCAIPNMHMEPRYLFISCLLRGGC